MRVFQMANTHFEGSKSKMFIVEFIDVFGKNKKVKFFNSHKAGDFYTRLKASPSISRLKKYSLLLDASEKRLELSFLKNRKD